MRRPWIGRFVFALILSGFGEQAFAQTVLQGRVTDSLGGAINGALVTLSGAEATSRTTPTGADGTFSFDGVPHEIDSRLLLSRKRSLSCAIAQHTK